MVTPSDIVEAVVGLLKAKYPGEEVYTDLQPNSTKRPCWSVTLEPYKGSNVAFGCESIELLPKVAVTAYGVTDEYYQSEQMELYRRQMGACSLFLPGYIKVKDRAPNVAELEFSNDYDSATVLVTFRLTLDRKDFLEIEQAPLAGDLFLDMKLKEE